MRRELHPIGKRTTYVCSDGAIYYKYNQLMNKKFTILELDSHALYKLKVSSYVGNKKVNRFRNRFTHFLSAKV